MTERVQSTAAQQVRTALAAGIEGLNAANVPSAALSAELILMHVLERDRAWLYAHPEHELRADQAGAYARLIEARAAGTPTQYLTGHQEFWGLDFEVTPAVLIPRPETEHVVEVALARVDACRNEALRIADIGTGSGCIAIALAHELPNARVVATDISAAALEVACRNATKHGVANRIDFLRADILDDGRAREFIAQVRPPQLGGEPEASSAIAEADPDIRSVTSLFDLIVSNPPYVARDEAGQLQREVRDHEPELALYGGPTGVEIYARLIDEATAHLCPGGTLVLELGYGAADHIHSLVAARPAWADISITNDLAGIPRILAATRISG